MFVFRPFGLESANFGASYCKGGIQERFSYVNFLMSIIRVLLYSKLYSPTRLNVRPRVRKSGLL